MGCNEECKNGRGGRLNRGEGTLIIISTSSNTVNNTKRETQPV